MHFFELGIQFYLSVTIFTYSELYSQDLYRQLTFWMQGRFSKCIRSFGYR